MISTSTLTRPETTRRINDFLYESVDGSPDDFIAFFCECEREDCYRSVWLTPLEYRTQRHDGQLRAYRH